MALYRFYLFLVCLAVTFSILPMEQGIEGITQGIAQIKGLSGSGKTTELVEYDSDSEDEEGYTYPGLAGLSIPNDKWEKECIALSRGIHFVPTNFTRKKRSELRRVNDAGKAIYCSAAYDLAGQPLDSNDQGVEEKAIEIRDQIIKMEPKDRNLFQQIYSNQYDGFHQRLGTDKEGGIFQGFKSKKNPQVSTSENFLHSEKYGCGLKFLGTGVEYLDPEYDASGRPKHPYLGKLFVILASKDQVEELAPYFVVHGHANDDITVSDHFRKNVLSEREASMAGLIPGNSVVLSIPLRVPSFKGDYKPFYQDKFGISKPSYSKRKKLITTGNKETVKTLLTNVILPHLAEKMEQHIAIECKAKSIRLVYKQFDGSFGQTLPPLINATDYKKRIKQSKL